MQCNECISGADETEQVGTTQLCGDMSLHNFQLLGKLGYLPKEEEKKEKSGSLHVVAARVCS